MSTYTFPSAFDGQPFLEAGLDLQTVAERGSPPLLHHDELARDERALNLELHHTLHAERVCVILFFLFLFAHDDSSPKFLTTISEPDDFDDDDDTDNDGEGGGWYR